MDFAKITQKMNSLQYSAISEFIRDVRLVFQNAMTFNPPNSRVYVDAKTLSDMFEKTWVTPKFESNSQKGVKVGIVRSDINGSGLSDSSSVTMSTHNDHNTNIARLLKKLKDHKDASIFLYPVDGTIYADYYTIIQKPIDLSKMTEKLNNLEYSSEFDFYNDVKLMFKNCFTYNRPGTIGYGMGVNMEKAFKREWDIVKKKIKYP